MPDNQFQNHQEPAASDNDQVKKQTARISLENTRPPKVQLNLKPATGPVPGIPTHAGPIPQTIRLKRPPTSPIPIKPAGLSLKTEEPFSQGAPTTARPTAPETVKRQTSRVMLDETSEQKLDFDERKMTGPAPGIPTHAGPIPQTIRLKRPPTSQLAGVVSPSGAPITVKKVIGKAGTQPISEAPTIAKKIAPPPPTFVTSRIIIDEAAPPETKQTPAPILPKEPPAQPRTIRLKRPSSLDEADASPQPEQTPDALQAAKKSETAKIELPAEDASQTPITQRKTIKIRRTERNVAPRTVAISRPGLAAQKTITPSAPMPAQPLAPESAPVAELGMSFSITAVAAVLCIAALVYIMTAEYFGIKLPLPSSMAMY